MTLHCTNYVQEIEKMERELESDIEEMEKKTPASQQKKKQLKTASQHAARSPAR